MDAEQTFAAEVFRAEQDAAKVRARGHPQTTSDIVTSALIDLWGRCAAQGLSSKAIVAFPEGGGLHHRYERRVARDGEAACPYPIALSFIFEQGQPWRAMV
jgi:hypothetical protein